MAAVHDFDRRSFSGIVQKLTTYRERRDLVIALIHDLEDCTLRRAVE